MDTTDWTPEQRDALDVLMNARPGDMVLWADRSVAMQVEKSGVDEDGNHWVDVHKPRGKGTYRVRERYQDDIPKFTSPIGRANNLHWVDRAPEPRGLSEQEYSDLIQRNVENAVDASIRLDYKSWDESVKDVVELWGDEVAFQTWSGYKHHPDWEEGDTDAIFESVIDHSMYDGYGEGETLRSKAEGALYKDIFHEGRQQAEENIVNSAADYSEMVDTLAQHTLDRYDRKNYSSARVAVRDTISDWIEDRQDPAHQSIIEHGNNRFEDDFYDGVDNEAQERAFDILDHDVWEEVQRLQRERGDHDPTIRGLTYTNYQDLVDHLAGVTMQRYDQSGFLRTTARKVVADWADEVENENWEGHRHRVYAIGDVEDIFASATIHADADPFTWNPFSDKIEMKSAKVAVTSDVVTRAELALDNEQEPVDLVPADEYIQKHISADMTYEDFADAHRDSVEETISRITESIQGDEVGWTFVDEIVEMDGLVTEKTNDWVLVDYGVLREGETLRKLAWFNRFNGDVLIMSGMANAGPYELDNTDEPYSNFHISLHEQGQDGPEFLLSDESLEDCLNYIYDYLDANRADIRVIDNRGDVFIEESIDADDINVGGVVDSLLPNYSWGTDDLVTLGDTHTRKFGEKMQFWGTDLARLTAYAAIMVLPKALGDVLDGVRVEPLVDKKHGVGTRVSKDFGKKHYEAGIGGQADIKINIRNKTFTNLAERYTPHFVKQGFRTDERISTRVIPDRIARRIESNRAAQLVTRFGYRQSYKDPVAAEIFTTDLDQLSLEELQSLADKTPAQYSDSEYNDEDSLREGLIDYAETVERVELGTKLIKRFGESLDFIRDIGYREEYEDPVAAEIFSSDIDSMSLEELQSLADKTSRDYSDKTYEGERYTDDNNDYENQGDALREELTEYAETVGLVESDESFKIGEEFLETYGPDGVFLLEEIFASGIQSKGRDDLRKEFLEDWTGRQISDGEVESEWKKALEDGDDGEKNQAVADYEKYVQKRNDFTWSDLENQDIGISGLFIRGLDAEALVKGAEYLDIDEWIKQKGTLYGSDYINGDPPTFEEWKEARYGPGQPSGPEQEAKRLARYHKEVAAGDRGPEPYDFFHTNEEIREQIEMQQDELGDYDTGYEEFAGTSFEDLEDIPESTDPHETPEDSD